MTTEILIFDGFDDLDAFGPFEVLSGAGLDTRLVTIEPQATVTSAHGARIVPHGVLGDPDLVIVPGGGWNDRAGRGAYYEARRGVITQALRERHEQGRRIGSVCTGAMLLAEAGILDGRPATTHHDSIDDLRGFGARVVEGARFVDAGDVITAGGVTSGIDMALHIVTQALGGQAAAERAADIEFNQSSAASASGRSTATNEYESAISTNVAARN
jgi:transcriptional regulator GlxA family with amidase domain